MQKRNGSGAAGSLKLHLAKGAWAALLATAVAGVALAAAPKTPAPPKAGATPKNAASRPAGTQTASSLIEDRAAKKLLSAGDSRMQLDQTREGIELYLQIVERYPRSAVRFDAFVRIGNFYLGKGKDIPKALGYFEKAAVDENENAELRAEAMLAGGRCFYEQQKYPQAFARLRQVTMAFPGTDWSNQAYFYIGNAHYKLGAYNRAIEAFSKVGMAISETEQGKMQAEIGKRLFVRVSDVDLVSLGEGAAVTAKVTSSSGDSETVKLERLGGLTSPNYLGEIELSLGDAVPGDGVLQVSGTDTVSINYLDAQTASKELNVPRLQTLKLVHNAVVDFMDGAFRDPLKGVVVGNSAYIRVIDLDRDVSAGADSVKVKVVAKRALNKAAMALYKAEDAEPDTGKKADDAKKGEGDAATTEPGVDEKPQFKIIDEVELTLTERAKAAAEDQSGGMMGPKSNNVHTGVFGGQVPIQSGDPIAGDAVLQVQVGDIVELQYTDEFNITGKPRLVVGTCRAANGAIARPQMAAQEIKDQQLEIMTRLKKAEALTNIGKIYKQLGLKEQATNHFKSGVDECEQLSARAKNLGGEALEGLYVRLWKLYLELDDLNKAAAMCLALQRDFPNSQLVDEALLGLGETEQKKGSYDRAIGVYRRVLDLPNTPKKADALFNIGICQEMQAKPKGPTNKEAVAGSLPEAALLSFQQVFQKYPQSGVAGEALGKIADHFMAHKEYDRAVSTFQQAMDEYPDAQFMDRVLFDYGRCLYRMDRKPEAAVMFRKLTSEYPQSKLAPKAKEAIARLEKSDEGD